MPTKHVLPLCIGTLSLTALLWLTNVLIGIETAQGTYGWSLLSSLLTCTVIFLLIKHSTLPMKQSILFVFAVYFIIGHLNILVEAYIFDVSSRTETLRELARGFMVAAIFAPLAVYLYQENRPKQSLTFTPRSSTSWIWRIAVADILYFVLYGLAGFILVTVYPKLLDFYADKIPPMELIIKTQLFLRGFLFIAVAVAILKFIDLSRFNRACLVGLTFAIFGGVAPLIPPNELMPGFVRFGHLFEVGVSNFVFGVLLGYLLGQHRIERHEAVQAVGPG
ncbi:MAG: hypothetical protein KTR29_25035 [Rhodothermaceae bacterium]|nr:hypothetical protein [Rhodothermaceae bacterium]